jgi:long-chain acyl-CoA synthetase
VHAVVVLRPGAEADEAELITHCRSKIAGYKAPRSVAFSTDPLPKSGPGKVLKRQLRDPHWAGHDDAIV